MKEKISKSLQVLLMAGVFMLVGIGMPILPQTNSGAALAASVCPSEATDRSINSNVSTYVVFNNKSTQGIKTYWLDYSGNRKFYRQLNSNESYKQQTYVTHPWVVTDLEDNCLGVYYPESETVEVAIADPAAESSTNEVVWTDWTTVSADLKIATGAITKGSHEITVTSTADPTHNFVQTDGGTDYWKPADPYLSTEVENAPSTPDIVTLNTGGTVTITFSEPVRNPLVALVSWNLGSVKFSAPIEVLSDGKKGYWGTGTAVLNGEKNGFSPQGELHGVIRLPGVYESLSFTHPSENWHGFTIGISDIAEVYNGIVNLDSIENSSKKQAVKVTLPAGEYTISVISQEEGGAYDAWTKNSKVTDCDESGKKCTKGWEHKYFYQLGDTKRVKIKGTGRYETPALALENLPEDVTFTIEEETEAIFYLQDKKDVSNNQGGVSLKIVGKK
ncbi:MAG: hypothetical protein J7647_00545 [Cyanobacteria bacterium SBLK]|nr:hypothetical protein [Cyanobacteria bacterium SBLK]